ncbi:MAG: hypothetical protein LBI31_06860 [Zoogloeaceae bacterium]|jgi:hypothetical protein|nr:hypothetical protein [Zoogloeaceae bacterium]
MKKLSLLLLFCAATAFAQEPPYIYKQFGFIPKEYKGALTAKQKGELDACLNKAREQKDQAKANGQASGDLFGFSISNCLANNSDLGKGWRVQEKTDAGWQDVSVLQVVRTFMGID